MSEPYYEDDAVTVHHGDCLDVLRELPDASVDAVVTDPPYLLGFMGRAWDTKAAHEHLDWHGAWAAEVLRVLKPGGHLLAFGGSRTWHRLACAIEDAGFEVRDSIAWLTGSGFPKSLDVSKAIDKRAEENSETKRRIALVAEVIRSYREAKGMERAEVSQAVVGTPSGACWNWEHHQLPSVEMWPAIKRTLGIPDKFDGLIKGDRAQFIAAEREVIGERTTGIGTGRGAVAYIGDSENRDITAPATDAAQQWQGWGTALKPAHEPVVVARKPLVSGGILVEIGSHLDRLEQEWRALAAAPITRTGRVDGSSAPTATSPSGSTGANGSNTVSSWRACWAELCSLLSTSTTATTSSTTTDLRTLSSSLSRLTATNMLDNATSPHGLTSTASAVDHLFASVVCGLRAILALSATEPATGGTRPERPAEDGNRFEPVVVARKPLTGTVAANVLAHGTGAINVDGCRIDAGGERFGGGANGSSGFVDGYEAGSGFVTSGQGRWPTNVVLSGDAADELDRQSGTLKSGSRKAGVHGLMGYMGADAAPMPEVVGDSGGASRFFPVFRYQAKAPTRERPKVDGIAHPTVKPLELMRWLVRLVTPPGGVVLEPFAGSGTTVEAAVLEGFQCIAIEREADYLPLILARLQRHQHTADGLPAVAEALTLWDEEEPA